MRYTNHDIDNLEQRYRVNLINSASGAKSANLIASVNSAGVENLALFSSVFHIGSNPALIGFVMRPVHVPRHTYANILEQKYFTINAVGEYFHQKAHLCSANFAESVSEFEACKISKQYLSDFPVPFVADSLIRLGCEIQDDLAIEANGCRIIVGRILLLDIQDGLVKPDGYIDLASAKVCAITGGDAYHTLSLERRYAYAKAFQPINEIT